MAEVNVLVASEHDDVQDPESRFPISDWRDLVARFINFPAVSSSDLIAIKCDDLLLDVKQNYTPACRESIQVRNSFPTLCRVE